MNLNRKKFKATKQKFDLRLAKDDIIQEITAENTSKSEKTLQYSDQQSSQLRIDPNKSYALPQVKADTSSFSAFSKQLSTLQSKTPNSYELIYQEDPPNRSAAFGKKMSASPPGEYKLNKKKNKIYALPKIS